MSGERHRRQAPPVARWCGQCNDILLVVALLLACVVTAGQQHPEGFAAVVAHLDWLAPPMDPQTGILLEHAISGATLRPGGSPSDENVLRGDARRLVASD